MPWGPGCFAADFAGTGRSGRDPGKDRRRETRPARPQGRAPGPRPGPSLPCGETGQCPSLQAMTARLPGPSGRADTRRNRSQPKQSEDATADKPPETIVCLHDGVAAKALAPATGAILRAVRSQPGPRPRSRSGQAKRPFGDPAQPAGRSFLPAPGGRRHRSPRTYAGRGWIFWQVLTRFRKSSGRLLLCPRLHIASPACGSFQNLDLFIRQTIEKLNQLNPG